MPRRGVRWLPAALLACSATLVACRPKESAAPLLDVAGESPKDSLICVVIRTYFKHSTQYDGGLTRLVESLQRQTYAGWTALLVVMDSTPFADLHYDVLDLNDDRVAIYANVVGPDYKPKKPDGSWKDGYHRDLYALTDEAIRACNPRTQWVVVTNGDNVYHRDAFDTLLTRGDDADMVAWDFYSRYQRPTGVPCERFAATRGADSCKANRGRWCHTDLGAVAYSWRRLLEEDRRFGPLTQEHRFTSQDAIMVEMLNKAGWRSERITRCLYDQGPSPQMCARSGGVWDERAAARSHDFGGHCVSLKDLEAAENDPTVEVLDIELANDGGLAGYLAAPADGDAAGQAPTPATHIKCIRPAQDYRFSLIPAFGRDCVDPADQELFKEWTALQRQPRHTGSVQRNDDGERQQASTMSDVGAVAESGLDAVSK